jgi:hypothetical protein
MEKRIPRIDGKDEEMISITIDIADCLAATANQRFWSPLQRAHRHAGERLQEWRFVA